MVESAYGRTSDWEGTGEAMNDLNHRGRRAPLVVVVSMLAVVGVGCGKSKVTPSESASAVSSDTTTSPAVTSSSEADTTPSPEGTEPESPQKSHYAGPSADLPSLPIGGGGAIPTVGAQQCAGVSWTGPHIPPGIVVTIDKISLSSEDIFKLEGTCTSGGAPCTTSLQWTSQTEHLGCSVAATQIASVEEQKEVHLKLSGRVLCGEQSKCDSFADSSTSGSAVSFFAQPGAIPGAASSSSSNPPPPSSDQSPPVTPSSPSDGSPS